MAGLQSSGPGAVGSKVASRSGASEVEKPAGKATWSIRGYPDIDSGASESHVRTVGTNGQGRDIYVCYGDICVAEDSKMRTWPNTTPQEACFPGSLGSSVTMLKGRTLWKEGPEGRRTCTLGLHPWR